MSKEMFTKLILQWNLSWERRVHDTSDEGDKSWPRMGQGE